MADDAHSSSKVGRTHPVALVQRSTGSAAHYVAMLTIAALRLWLLAPSGGNLVHASAFPGHSSSYPRRSC
jgi:hypothetical protein